MSKPRNPRRFPIPRQLPTTRQHHVLRDVAQLLLGAAGLITAITRLIHDTFHIGGQ